MSERQKICENMSDGLVGTTELREMNINERDILNCVSLKGPLAKIIKYK